MHENINLIVLNDLRAVPILTVLKLKRTLNFSILIAHESLFKNREYADHTNILWKTFLKYILILFFNLKVVKVKSQDIKLNDMGLESSLFSITEDSQATSLKYPVIFRQLQRLVWGAQDIVNYISENKFSNVYLFNGRTASSYLITKYCVSNNIRLVYYEYAGHRNGFRLFPVPPHASGRIGEFIFEYYRYGIYNLASIRISANKFRSEKLNSEYAKANKQNPTSSYDIVIFLGSDFEYTSIDFQICGVKWQGNRNFCISVIEKYGQDFSYAIRCHPNSAADPNWNFLYEELIKSVKSFDCRVDLFGPDVLVDSHQLIKNASLVVTDLSTIAIDAIILGKKVEIFGNTDIKYIYKNVWFNNNFSSYISDAICEPFSLGHNFFVFRFSMIEKILCQILYYFHRAFAKYEIWRNLFCYKK
jgi:hypothetical protein